MPRRRRRLLRAPTSSPGKTLSRPRPRSSTYSADQRPIPRSACSSAAASSSSSPVMSSERNVACSTRSAISMSALDFWPLKPSVRSASGSRPATSRASGKACAPHGPDGQATVGRGEPVEQLDADRECELLTRDRVRQALEQRRESGRLQPAELLGELTEVGIATSQPVEAAEIDLEPEHALERAGRLCSQCLASRERVLVVTATSSRGDSGGRTWVTEMSAIAPLTGIARR